MSVRTEDLVLLLTATGFLALVILLCAVVGRFFGVSWRRVLTAPEWRVAARLVCLLALLWLLLLCRNALDLPQEMFIYGRF